MIYFFLQMSVSCTGLYIFRCFGLTQIFFQLKKVDCEYRNLINLLTSMSSKKVQPLIMSLTPNIIITYFKVFVPQNYFLQLRKVAYEYKKIKMEFFFQVNTEEAPK